MTDRQRVKLKLLQRQLRIAGEVEDSLTVSEASDLIDSYEQRIADGEAGTNAALAARRDPHEHLPPVGSVLQAHAELDYRAFITDRDRRAGADPDPYGRRGCPGIYHVAGYVPGAPLVEARCDACGEEYAFKVDVPAVAA